MLCVSLILSSCATKPLVINAYCTDYEPVIQQKGDGAAVASILNLPVKRRILGNETIYRGLKCNEGGK